MAYRTTLSEVQLLSEDFEDMTSAQMEPCIIWAHTIVTDQIAGDSATTSTKLGLITRYLAAHAATCFVREAMSQKAGSVAESYGKGKMLGRLDSTRFGKNAILLDSTGALSKLNSQDEKTKTASMSNLWTEPESW